ncbi:HMG box transcription factor [Metarhizium acridum CQMa 102]|uniref:HMG box transcription factor n=2 Tax=Metarhizium acridum TaxID=92637 RepID=E9EBI1_METAQ|nr:HMG box transcription factor [Metarhizium acridum CQMa 102]ALI93566.1 MATA [Metarhizium acridum]EFY86728.1 HMG box transcription factor [Metarhizium acridum CQMa 102]
MTDVLSFATRDMETVRASLHPHINLQKPFRNSRGFTLSSDGRQSPSPFRSGSGRKRASTINTADANHGMFEPLNVGASSQDGPRDIICLCTPAPKIPRPRNAFILYRQHHQSQVTAENPKLSNPEISKIIGDKWKHESEDVKDNWKKLAEEEKQRHQHQYPNYRYQPRRSAKNQSTWTSTSPMDEHGRCPKCHGRSISTPRTPSTPYSTSPAGNFTLASQPQPGLRRLDTAALSRRSSFEQSPTSGLPFTHQLPPVRDVEKSEPSSPEIKRRRANGAGGYHVIAGTTGAYTTRPPPPPDLSRTLPEGTAGLVRHYAGTTLPDLAGLPRSQSGPMPPPLRPPGSSPWSLDKEPLSRRHSGFDESLRLPPLQTSIPPSPSRSPGVEGRHADIPSARLNVSPTRKPHSISQEAIAMNKPNLSQKLGLLSTITRVLPPEGQHGPHRDKRGVFIAVEGNASKGLIDEVGVSVEKALAAGGDVALKVWSNEADLVEGGSSKTSAETDRGNDSACLDSLLSEYFATILSWRQRSRQIAYHVTGGRAGANIQGQDQDKDLKVVQAPSTEVCTPPDDGRRPTAVPKMPVALVKGGFSLTISDQYASAMTMSDRYSPVDHWQWTASLWRGTASPDLVVHIQESNDDASKPGVVDISRNMGLISVRVSAGQGLDEATERRMAFEVMEWMREAFSRD